MTKENIVHLKVSCNLNIQITMQMLHFIPNIHNFKSSVTKKKYN